MLVFTHTVCSFFNLYTFNILEKKSPMIGTKLKYKTPGKHWIRLAVTKACLQWKYELKTLGRFSREKYGIFLGIFQHLLYSRDSYLNLVVKLLSEHLGLILLLSQFVSFQQMKFPSAFQLPPIPANFPPQIKSLHVKVLC